MKQKDFENLKHNVQERIAFLKFQEKQETKKYHRILIVFLIFTFISLLTIRNFDFSSGKDHTSLTNRNYSSTLNTSQEFPSYFAGFYQEGEEYVALLTENTLEHQREIKKIMGMETIRFEKVLFSLKELREASNFILEKEYDFVESVEIHEKENCVVVILNPYTEENKEKILDRSGKIRVEKSDKNEK